MEKQTFHITIDASREKVWELLWGDSTYPVWTSVFSEGSHAESDWKEGSKVLFLNKENHGMVSTIASSKAPGFMSFRHLGEVRNGVEDYENEKFKSWAGAMENYTLKDLDGKTELTVEIDIVEEHKEYFASTFPKAIAKLKEMAE